MRSNLFFVAVALCSFGTCSNAHAESLREAISGALENHPAIEGAYLGYKASEHGRSVEFSNYYPELSVNLTAARSYQDNSTSRGLSVERGAAYTGVGEGNISLRQMMFDGLETKNRVVAAEARMDSLNYNIISTQDEITLRVAQGYVEVLRLLNSLKILEEQSTSIKDYQKRIIEMVSEGIADEAELQQARDVAMVIDGMIAEYEGQLISAKAAYYESAGEDFLGEANTIPDSLEEFIIKDISASIEIAKEQHPLLQSSRMDSKVARHEMKAEHGKLYPDISGEVSYAKTDKRDIVGGETKDARIGLKMNWSFSTGGGDVSSVRQKRFKHYEASANHKALEREIERDVNLAYASYDTIKRKNALSKDRLDLNEKLLDAYNVQFQGGLISLLSLMRAESQFFNARLEHEENKYNILLAEYALLSSVGQLKHVLLTLSVADENPLVEEAKN